jgi:hypothetical protein
MTITKFGAGDWFAVPLPDGNWVVGRIARRGGPALLGYFFGPRRAELPALAELKSLHAADAVWVTKFSYLGLRDGEWPILHGAEDFDSTAWPMPMFPVRGPDGSYEAMFYPEDKPGTQPILVSVTKEVFERLPKGGAAGSKYVENWLDRILPPLDNSTSANKGEADNHADTSPS